jgi:hypothetical protein
LTPWRNLVLGTPGIPAVGRLAQQSLHDRAADRRIGQA